MPVPMVMDSTARKRARRELELAWWKSPLVTAFVVLTEKGRQREKVRGHGWSWS